MAWEHRFRLPRLPQSSCSKMKRLWKGNEESCGSRHLKDALMETFGKQVQSDTLRLLVDGS